MVSGVPFGVLSIAFWMDPICIGLFLFLIVSNIQFAMATIVPDMDAGEERENYLFRNTLVSILLNFLGRCGDLLYPLCLGIYGLV